MSRFLLLHSADAADAIVATSLVRSLESRGQEVTIVGDSVTNEIMSIAGYRCSSFEEVASQHFDLAANLSPSFSCTALMGKIAAEEKLGYGQDESGLFFYNDGAHHHYRAKFIKIPSGANQFQLLYGLAGTKWQGEGYTLRYFPRNKMKKALTGIAIRDNGLREYVLKNLKLGQSRLWRVPIKQNVCKQLDEVNRCRQIVTDDLTVAHVALALRKSVEFLTAKTLPYKFEMFGNGSVHIYDPKVIRDERAQFTLK